jgi:hypothetical protein
VLSVAIEIGTATPLRERMLVHDRNLYKIDHSSFQGEFARLPQDAPEVQDRPAAIATAIAVAAAAWISFGQPASSQENADQRPGTVHFDTSCNETAQRRFDRGMRYQHSFWYQASKEIFEETLKADPQCAIAYWGIALGLLDNPHNPPPAPNLKAVRWAEEK